MISGQIHAIAQDYDLGINTRVQFHATKRISIAFGSVVRFLVWFREMAVHIHEAIRDHACAKQP